MPPVTFDFGELKSFFNRMDKAAKGGFLDQLALYLEGVGFEFLRIMEDTIIDLEVVDTRLLLNSFHRGEEGNVWEFSGDGLTLEVGTNVEYAAYVNNGHWTCKQGQEKRFVPGYWQGDKFIYDPSAKSGMVLKAKYVQGRHFYEKAMETLDKIYPPMAEKMLQRWIDEYFS